jgi:hypothetical protein
MSEVTEGMTLRANITGRTYHVQSVEDGKVHFRGLMPVSKEELERDIDNGKIDIVG